MNHVTPEERALQTWQVLISAAHNRQLFTYGLMADLIGVGKDKKGAIAMHLYLGILMRYCHANRLPPITVLVVQAGAGKPGSGLTTLGEHPDRRREEVFDHEWFKLAPLTVEALRRYKHSAMSAAAVAS